MPDWRKRLDAALLNERLEPSRLTEIRDEIASHLDDRYHELLAEGAAPAEAENKVLEELQQRLLGPELRNVLKPVPLTEGETEGESFFASILRDVSYGFRQLRHSPAFATAALLSLALGIGANTAIFELLDAVRMRTLPVASPERLASIKINAPKGRVGSFRQVSDLTTNLLEALRARQHVFSDFAGWSVTSADLSQRGEVRYGRIMFAGGSLFDLLSVKAVRGRMLQPRDDQRGCTAPPAVISYAYWQNEMGGRASAVGERVWVNRHSFEVIGITAPSFFGIEVGRRFSIALPLCAESIVSGEGSLYNVGKGWWLGGIGRLASGMTMQSASAQLEAMSPALMQSTVPSDYNAAQATNYAQIKLAAEPAGTGYSRLRRTYDRPFWILLGISALVLLIACANLANLMLARAAGREREMAVRLALGASRLRLLRQLLIEGFLLAAIGAVLGAALAQALGRALVPFLGGKDQHIFVDLHLDWRVLAFTAALALITCLLFGLSPALQASRVAPGEVVKAAGRGIVSARSRFGVRRVLVVVQIAFSLVLVLAAMLFVGTFRNLLTVDPGFRPDGLIVANVDFSSLKIPPAQRAAYKNRITETVSGLPGVVSVARNRFELVNGGAWNEEINIASAGTSKSVAWFDQVTPGYLKTIGTALIAGREFTEADNTSSQKVAIITRTFANKLFHESQPLGKTFGVVQYGDKPDEVYQVVGVAQDVKYVDLRGDFEPVAFVPEAQDPKPDSYAALMVRSGQPPNVLMPEIRTALLNIEPDLVLEFSTMKDDIADGLVAERLMAMLAGFFGALAIVLAVVGLYGVIAYLVARRTNEIGIRMALGARRGNILFLIMREVALICACGIAVGIALAAGAAPAARSLLFGVHPMDPSTLVFSVAGVVIVAAAASLVPAIRAATLDPMEALHDQ